MQKSLKENSKREQQGESSLSHILVKCFYNIDKIANTFHSETVFKRKEWCMVPYAGVDYYLFSPYLIVNSVVSYPLQRKRSGEDLSYWLSTFLSVCQFPKQPIGKGRVQRRGRKGVRADLMSLNRHFKEHGQPHACADFNPTL
jgi:hypothetical protein